MEAIRVHEIIKKDGEIHIKGLPFKKGEQIEMLMLPEIENIKNNNRLTARNILNSKLIGLWKNCKDIKNSTSYARKLRDFAQNRKK